MLDFTMKRVDGTEQPLTDYQGKVVMMVNVASKCGLTPQYKGLQALYEKYNGQGLEILGFPANNFMGQEPGTDDEIATFCDMNYNVTFPLFSKISVKGDDIHPLYKAITTAPAPIGGDVQWNFQKYLLDRKGNAVAKFLPMVTPEDPALIEALEAQLAS